MQNFQFLLLSLSLECYAHNFDTIPFWFNSKVLEVIWYYDFTEFFRAIFSIKHCNCFLEKYICYITIVFFQIFS